MTAQAIAITLAARLAPCEAEGKHEQNATMISDDSSWLAPVGPPVSGLMAG